MNEVWRVKADRMIRLRWAVWLTFSLLWSAALLVPNPIDFLLEHNPTGIELSHRVTFLLAKSLHVAAYATAAVLTGWLRAPGPWRWVLFGFWTLHADMTEVGQLFVPGRTGSPVDVAIDHFGLLVGLALSWRWWRSAS